MFFLHAATYDGMVTLHVRGFSNKNGCGLVDGEGIFEVEKRNDPENPNSLMMAVTRQVGVVKGQGDQPFFDYTDEFKKQIGYQEDTGYSSLDGGLWAAQQTQYSNPGETKYNVNPPRPMHFTYNSARRPFTALPNLARLFTRFQNNDQPDIRKPPIEPDSGASSSMKKTL